MQPGRYVLIAVSDTGSGIPAAIRDKVFEPFFTTKEVGKGTGLGLSMVYGFVKQSGGHIKIYSEEGHGTTFKIYLPRRATCRRTCRSTEPPSSLLERGNETILVVEDDPLVRGYVTAQIQSLGYKTLSAANAAEALAHRRRRRRIRSAVHRRHHAGRDERPAACRGDGEAARPAEGAVHLRLYRRCRDPSRPARPASSC